jgi:hypothetical protein
MIYEGNSGVLLSAFLAHYVKYVEFFNKLDEKESSEYIKSLESSLGKKKLVEMSEIFFSCRISFDMFMAQVEKDMDETVVRYVEKNKDSITFN